MASNSIVYSGTTINIFLAPVASGYTRTAAATNIQQGGADINTLYAGWDNRAGNQPTATGAVKANATDIATLFNKYSPVIDISGNYSIPKFKIPSGPTVYYCGTLLRFTTSGTGPIKIDYSDSSGFSASFNNPFPSGTTFNNFGYLGGVIYNYTITAGGGVGGYVTVTGSFKVPVV